MLSWSEFVTLLNSQVDVIASLWPTLLLLAGAMGGAIYFVFDFKYGTVIANLKSENALMERQLKAGGNLASSPKNQDTVIAKKLRHSAGLHMLEKISKQPTIVTGDPRVPEARPEITPPPHLDMQDFV